MRYLALVIVGASLVALLPVFVLAWAVAFVVLGAFYFAEFAWDVVFTKTRDL